MNVDDPAIEALLHQQDLPAHYKGLLVDFVWPLSQQLHLAYRQRNQHADVVCPWLLGIQGTQGSGKTTVSLFLKLLLESQFNYSVVSLSLDDFYLTRLQRTELANVIHPLLKTRGVPGTHDVELALNSLTALAGSSQQSPVYIPRFDKATDDRHDKQHWLMVNKKVDIILLEGWCVGAPAQSAEELKSPMNQLERIEDANGVWRQYVNDKLKGEYKRLFNRIDDYIVLQAPSFEQVYQWRLLQEQKLANQMLTTEVPSAIMNQSQVRTFISYFERLSRHCLQQLPKKARWLLTLNEHHDMVKLSTLKGSEMLS